MAQPRASGETWVPTPLRRLVEAVTGAPKRVDFAFATPYGRHVPNLVRIADRMRERGHGTAFIALDDLVKHGDAQPVLAQQPAPVIPYRRFDGGRFRPDLLVVLNDTGLATRPLVERAHELGIPTVALTNLVVNLNEGPDQYTLARHVLGTGRYIADRLDREDVQVVGAPELEDLLAGDHAPPDQPLAVVNCKFRVKHFADKEASTKLRMQWLTAVAAACEKAGIDLVISQHPRDKGKLAEWPVSTEPIRDLLRRATLVISTPSAVILEAMALGVPVVCHRSGTDESLESSVFDDPMGAYRNTRSPEELDAAVAEAAGWTRDYRERCHDFFQHHVDVDPSRTMTDRVADALVALRAAEAG